MKNLLDSETYDNEYIDMTAEHSVDSYNRRTEALRTIEDCKVYLTTRVIRADLNRRLEAIRAQESGMSVYESIEILLDSAERELNSLDEAESKNTGLLSKIKNFFKMS